MDPPKFLFPLSRQFPVPISSPVVDYAVVDAFTGTPFKGNPAAVCLLPASQEDNWMQQVASEFNLSQTAFLGRHNCCGSKGAPVEGSKDYLVAVDTDYDFDIRWFTPCAEVDLCGHATLASSYLLFASGVVSGSLIRFHTKRSGILTACRVEKETDSNSIDGARDGNDFLVELKFPILSSIECNSELAMLSSTLKDTTPVSFRRTIANDLLVELSSGEEVEALEPCFEEVKKLTARGLIVTGPASEFSGYDFISRFFAPKVGINEDPVCGQAHCALAAFWAEKLKKERLTAYQASKRGGVLHLRVDFETGQAYLRGAAVVIMSGILLDKL